MENLRRLPSSDGANGDRAISPIEVIPSHGSDPTTPLVDVGSSSGLVEYWKIILRHRRIVILLMVLGGVGGFLWTLPQTPIYHANATLEVQWMNQDFLNFKDGSPNSMGMPFDPVADILTQVKLVESQSIRERTLAKLKAKPASSTTATLADNRLQAWKQALHLDDQQAHTWENALAMAAGSLSVRAPGTTRIMDVSADSTDPRAAAEFVNGLINEFIEQDMESRLTSSALNEQWLARQLDDLKIKLEKSEDQLQAYASAAGLQMTESTGSKDDHDENVATARLRALQGELLTAQDERVKTQSKYELVSSAPIDSLPEVVDDANLREYQNKLADLRRQLADLKVSYTAENPKVMKVQLQVNEVEKSFQKERQNVVSRIKNDYDAALRRERLIQAEYDTQLKLVNSQASQTTHYDILKREADTNRQIYEAMLQKVKEAGIASALRASNYKMVDAAQPPGGPYKPNASQSSVMGALAGLLLGIMFVLVRERADRSLQQPGDATHFLNLAELGVIPSDRTGQGRKLYASGGRQQLIQTGQSDPQEVALATYNRRHSVLAESFHDALTSILFSGQNGAQPQVIAMCSAGPGEGKTTISANLAVALADINQKVLLIDADMRRPRQHTVFNLPNNLGLSTLLRDHSPILGSPQSPVVLESKVHGLWVMPSGPAVSNAANLLYSPRLAELMRGIRSEFDFVLIDTPPMLQIADARIIGQHCDTVVLVIRAGKTTRDVARTAKLKFQQDGTPVLGVILNDWIPGVNGYGFDSKYYERYSKYYGTKKESASAE